MDYTFNEKFMHSSLDEYQMMENDAIDSLLIGGSDNYTHIEQPLLNQGWSSNSGSLKHFSNFCIDDYSSFDNMPELEGVVISDRFPSEFSKDRHFELLQHENPIDNVESSHAMLSDGNLSKEEFSNFAGSRALLNIFNAETIDYNNEEYFEVIPSPLSAYSSYSDECSLMTADQQPPPSSDFDWCDGVQRCESTYRETKFLEIFKVDVFDKLMGAYDGKRVVGRPSFFSSSAGLNSCIFEVNGAIGTQDQQCSNNYLSLFRVSLNNGFMWDLYICDDLNFITDLEWIDRHHLAVSHGTGTDTSIDMFFLDKKLKFPICKMHRNEVREMTFKNGKLISVGYDGLVVITDVHRIAPVISNKRDLPISPYMCFPNEVIGSVRCKPDEDSLIAVTFDGYGQESSGQSHRSWAMIDTRTHSTAMVLNTMDCVYASDFLDCHKIALGTELGKIIFYDIRRLLGTYESCVNVLDIVGDLHFHPSTGLLAAWGEPGMTVGLTKKLDIDTITWNSIATDLTNFNSKGELNVGYGSFIPSQRDAYICTNSNVGMMKLIKIPSNYIN